MDLTVDDEHQREECEFVWVDISSATRKSRTCSAFSGLGPKALGLVNISKRWTPPFLFVSSDLYTDFKNSNSLNVDSTIRKWSSQIRSGLELINVTPECQIILRSSSSEEGLGERGFLDSLASSYNNLEEGLEKVLQLFYAKAPEQDIGLIVQLYVKPILRGHLSNERRVKEEARDGLVQMENVATGEITRDHIGYRKWRDEYLSLDDYLPCRSLVTLKQALHKPLSFAAKDNLRMHFEWIWDGFHLYIVQADVAKNSVVGTSPISVLGSPTKEPDVLELKVFRRASSADRGISSKLENHLQYEESGFWQPKFYILDDMQSLRTLDSGKITELLYLDLKILTSSLLVIRTSCRHGQVNLLPRSHLLASADSAAQWLKGDFLSDLTTLGLAASDVVLIAHHYVQAVSSAFSKGGEDRQDVRIESSWGIPEGLYYYPHDTHIVNTLEQDPRNIGANFSKFDSQLKSKGPKQYFVAPHRDTGHFVRYEIGPPFDWKVAIDSKDTLNKIAAYTRRLAVERGYPINLMWFIGCRTPEGSFDAIPWYCEKLQEQKVTKYSKNSKDYLYKISTEADLLRLEAGNLLSYSSTGGGRLVVELNPAEDFALRDTRFAERVGNAVSKENGVVILNGATLSHIFYILQRTTVTVCSESDTDIEPDIQTFRKLVRNRIPEVVQSSGEQPTIAYLGISELQEALKNKLVEEAFEVKEAGNEDLIGELADVMEVVKSLAENAGSNLDVVEEERRRKELKRGGFDDGIVLLSTSYGETEIGGKTDSQTKILPEEPANVAIGGDALDNIETGRRDIRNGNDFWELIQNPTVPLSRKEWSVRSSVGFNPKIDLSNSNITWELKGYRDGINLKLKLTIHIGDKQVSLFI